MGKQGCWAHIHGRIASPENYSDLMQKNPLSSGLLLPHPHILWILYSLYLYF